jgi:uncharacterized membrane protein YuzA (DUF378 family)
MNNLNTFDWIALVLLIIGGINWGMIGSFNVDLVSLIFGAMTIPTRIVYAVVGISALYSMYILSEKTT